MTTEDPKLLLLSDVHLGAFSEDENRRLEDELIRLIDWCEENSYRILLLGDLFEYWMEYPSYVPPLGKRLLERFRLLHQKHEASLFVTGNHDNWTLGHFASLGFEVEPNHRIIDLPSHKLMVLHGDGLEEPHFDLPRPLFHRLIRHPLFIKIFRKLLPPKAGLAVMKQFSLLSRRLGVEPQDKKLLNKWAEKQLKRKDNDIDVIICGHDHHPRQLKNDFGTFINLGTFYHDKTVALYNKGEFSLVVWNSSAMQPEPFHTDLKLHE